jgi:hypothetical protein
MAFSGRNDFLFREYLPALSDWIKVVWSYNSYWRWIVDDWLAVSGHRRFEIASDSSFKKSSTVFIHIGSVKIT